MVNADGLTVASIRTIGNTHRMIVNEFDIGLRDALSASHQQPREIPAIMCFPQQFLRNIGIKLNEVELTYGSFDFRNDTQYAAGVLFDTADSPSFEPRLGRSLVF